jgi:hypothetical protein
MCSLANVRVILLTAVVVSTLTGFQGAAPAVAQPTTAAAASSTAAVSTVANEIAEANRKAVALFKEKQIQAAHTELLAARKRGTDEGLGAAPVMAQTELHLGVVSIAGLDDWLRGMEHFARALVIEPNISLPPALATPQLKRDLREARRIKLPPARASGTDAPTASAVAETAAGDGEGDCWVMPTNADEPPLPKPIPQPLYCPMPELGPVGEAVPLFCVTQPNISEGSKVLAYYRSTGGVAYTPLPMKRTKTGWLTAAVPPKAVKGRALQVYFEAHDRAGVVTVSNGMDETPNVILLKAGVPRIRPRSLTLLEAETKSAPKPASDEATPLELRAIAEQKAEVAALTPKGRSRRAAGRLWLGLGFGSGMGWHSDRPLERHPGRAATAGRAPTGLGHFSPELGYQWTPRLSISLLTRHQYLPTTGSGDADATGTPPQLAHAVLARVQYALLGLGDLQLVGSLALGGGSALRMKVSPNTAAGVAASDTVVVGPLVGGPGLLLAYNLTSNVVATLESRFLAAFPAVGIVGDLTAGLQVAF